eukprot:Gb_02818 [translate_table: standard]
MEESSQLPSDSEIVLDLPKFIRIYKDGTVDRFAGTETVDASEDFKDGVASRDVILDPQTGVYVRLFLPQVKEKIPLLVYIHGGGFCIESAASPIYHTYLSLMAQKARVMCVSVDYRLAPEHRLPAAYDDCLSVLEWLSRQANGEAEGFMEPWLNSYADYTNCYLAGDSAGANIVHQMGIVAKGKNWGGLRIKGAIAVHPFFGGEEPIGCELGAEGEAFQRVVNGLWKAALPLGEDRDYPPTNPVGPRSPNLSTLIYPRLLVAVAGKDMLRDRGLLYYESLKSIGRDVDLVTMEDEDHVFHLWNPYSENAELLMKRFSDFIHSSA